LDEICDIGLTKHDILDSMVVQSLLIRYRIRNKNWTEIRGWVLLVDLVYPVKPGGFFGYVPESEPCPPQETENVTNVHHDKCSSSHNQCQLLQL